MGTILLRLVLALVVGGAACTPTANDAPATIPITTTSQEALGSFLEGRDLVERLRVQDSRPFFEDALERDPDFALAHLYLAFAYGNNPKRFFTHLGEAMNLAGKVSEGESLWIKGFAAGTSEPVKRLEYYTRLVELFPQDHRAHNLLASHYFAQQDYENAISEYERVVELAPGFVGAHNQLGYAYRALNQYQKAEKAFKEYIRLIPEDPNPYDSYAELLMKMGRFEESTLNYEKALSRDPGFLASRLGIAANLAFQDRHQESEKYLRESYKHARDDGEQRQVLAALVTTYADEGKLRMALQALQERYRIARTSRDLAAMSMDLNWQGNLLLETGDLPAAKAAFQESLNVVQKSPLSQELKVLSRLNNYYQMSRYELARGEYQIALAEAEKFRAGAEETGDANLLRKVHELAGLIALAREDYERASRQLERANTEDPYVIYHQALALKGQGDHRGAQRLLEKAAKHYIRPSLRYALIRKKAKELSATGEE